MRLPNAEDAVVPEPKITRYLLSLAHPGGRGKALFFLRFGFSEDTWESLADALVQHALDNEVSSVESRSFGTRYVVEGAMPTPDGRAPRIRSVWFVEGDERAPRFVTAYPLPQT